MFSHGFVFKIFSATSFYCLSVDGVAFSKIYVFKKKKEVSIINDHHNFVYNINAGWVLPLVNDVSLFYVVFNWWQFTCAYRIGRSSLEIMTVRDYKESCNQKFKALISRFKVLMLTYVVI